MLLLLLLVLVLGIIRQGLVQRRATWIADGSGAELAFHTLL